jgi:uncharacterized protein YaaN involved in tellurite resistance
MADEIKLEWGVPAAEPNVRLEEAVASEARKNPLLLSALSEDDRKRVMEFTGKIDITDSAAIGSYGAESQNKIAAFSDNVLKNVRTKDTGEAGRLLTNLVVEIKGFDATTGDKSGFLGIFNGAKKRFERISTTYSKVETNVDKITSALENHRRVLLKDVAVFDEMYSNNYAYYRELTLYIIAGKEKLDEVNNRLIPELRAKAEETKDEIDAQKLNDAQNAANRFEKKLHDLALSRMVSIQMAPQIRLIQGNDTTLVDKIQSSIVNAIPLWKNQIVIALGLADAKAALESQKKVTDMTNELLRKNSELLKQGSLEIAEESERSIISIETIQKTNSDLIDTINGIIEIQRSGHEKRVEAENRLQTMEAEFKAALLTAGKK